jgi:hypothetical protein
MMVAILLFCQFCVEGLWLTRFMPILLGFGIFGGVILVTFSEHLPLSAQRAISFLPVKVDPMVTYDAEGSVQWRLEMWQVLVPQIKDYWYLGKGYRIDPDELYFAIIGGGATDIQAQGDLVAGNYHSGPLSLIIPLGIWGVAGFFWLVGAGINVLHRNFKYGEAELRNINVFLLAYFLMQIIAFFFIFGAFNSQFYFLTGILGLSVSVNGGVAERRRVVARSSGVAVISRSQSPFAVRV